MTPDAVIVDAVRTPSGRGKPGGALSGTHPVDLLAGVLTELVTRTGIDPAAVDDVIGGCVSQGGEQSANITRNAVLAAGFPEHVPATTVDRQCGSSQQAVHFAAQGVLAGAYDVLGDDPILMLRAVVPATELALERAGLSIEDIDAFEVNEAFAPVPLVWQEETGADGARLNKHGGAIALGHQLGSSGTRLLTTLLGVLEADGGRYGLQTMCEGGGMANATVVERVGG